MKGIKTKRGLLKRVPVAKELLFGELVYFMAGEAVVIICTLLFARESLLSWTAGFLEGVLLAIVLMLHMAVSVEDSVSMLEEEALKHTRKSYIIRMVALVIAFLLIIFFRLGDIIAALFGLMALKVSAYIQPFTHKVIQKNKSKGR